VAPPSRSRPQSAATPGLTVAEIVEKNAAARGGVAAWRKLQTIAFAGHVESASAPARRMPFLLEQERPNRTRFELMAENQRLVRVYDGTNGWKLRPNASGRPETKSYEEDELRYARNAQVIEGPLMDAVARGAAITLGGIGAVEDRTAYALDIKLADGANYHVWVDAETFLELRYDREFRNARGAPAVASVYYRDYRTFEGLQVPLVIETSAAASQARDKLVIERVALNPKFDDRMFARPPEPGKSRRRVTVDTREAAAPSPARLAQ
jgi:outer membrane lipoprotein-sorting protein